MSRLVVISNRVAVPKARGAAGAQGGLAGALNAALKEKGGIWFGWSGQECETFTGALNVQKSDEGVTTATIDLEHQDVEEYYNGYANSTLWPLFHYRIDLTEYEREYGKGYERVNERFADAVRPLITDGDQVWVEGAEGGRVKVKALVTPRVDRNVAFMPFHFGGMFQGESLHDRYPEGTVPYVIGEAANTATTYGYDPVTLMQETKCTICRIERA